MSDFLADLRSALGDRFRIDRELTGGGMSRVFVAEEVALGRTVVLKVLPPDATATVNADRFRREVQFAARLQHPHIVPVLSSGEDAGTLWYTMPYVEGDTLRGRLAKGRMELRDALTLWQHMLDALSHAHKAGIVHRDMKPDNVLVSGRNALVTDFGIAKAVASATAGSSAAASGLTGVGFVVGTPAYMAPEQAAGMEAVDARTDLYSTALVAYEMLTGKAAFGGLTPPQTLAAQVQTMPAAPRSVNPDVPSDVEALLMQCLAKDPQQRPASADNLIDALDAIVRGVGTPSRETAAAAPKPAGRRALKRGAVLGIIVALGVIFWPRGKSETPVERDLVVLASFTHEPKDSSVARALSEAFRIDLQQSPQLRVADPQLVRTTLQTMRLDPAVTITDSIAKALGTRLGAKAYVTGTLSSLGAGYVLTARLVSVVDGTEVAALRKDADSPSRLLDATDRLSKALREKAGESVASLRSSPALPAATTSNLEALEHYAAGVVLMREGKQVRALEEYEKAIALDSMFASAWSGVATSLSNIGARPGDRQRAAQRAYDLRGNLPEIERLRLEARYHAARGDTEREIAVQRRILAIDPKQYAVLNNLGRLMLGRLQYASAESLLKAAVQLQPGAVAPTDMLFAVAAETGNQRLYDSLARAIPAGASGARLRLSAIESQRVAQARYTEYAKELDSLLQSSSSDLDLQGYLLYQRMPLYLVQGQLRTALQVTETVIAPVAKTVDPSLVPGVELNLAQGWARFVDDRARALQFVKRADAFYTRQQDVEDRAVLPRAWTLAIIGDPAGARRVLAEQTIVLPKDSLFRQFVEGEIALAEGKPTEALRLIQPTIGKELLCNVCGMGALARTYERLGQRDSVLAIYTRLLDSRSTNGRLPEDMFERAQALKRTGELLEERKDLTGALARYRAFVELWENADTELQPIVKEVRERITRIERSRG